MDALAKLIEDEIFRLEFSEYNATDRQFHLTVEQDKDPSIVVLGGSPKKIMVCTGEALLRDLSTLPIGTDWTTLTTTIRQSLIKEF